VSFKKVRASSTLLINANMIVHYNSFLFSGFLHCTWHSTGTSNNFILNRNLFWVT